MKQRFKFSELLSCLLALLLMIGMMPVAGATAVQEVAEVGTAGEIADVAEATEVADAYGDLTYSISDGEVTITGGDYTATEVIIPAEVEGYPVTSIGDEAFYWCTNLKSVTIPEGVMSIGDLAFAKCKNLTNISIPSSVIDIGDGAFSGCESLKSITVDVNNNVYDSRSDCNAIIETSTNALIFGCNNSFIPFGVICIGDSAFYSCISLENIAIPESVTSIGVSAFSNCISLENLTIPSSVVSVGEYAFSGCISLKNVEISSNLTSITYHMFAECTNLESVTIPSGVLSIDDYAFFGCSSLVSITIPSSVATIGNSAFSGCSSLVSITIPSGVTKIRNSAFSDCSSLNSVTIPLTVRGIEHGAFFDCDNLNCVLYYGTREQLDSAEIGYCFNTFAYIYCVPEGLEYTIRGNEVVITDYTGSYDCNIEIPPYIEGLPVSVVAQGAFNCTQTLRIHIPYTVVTIEDYAFNGENSHVFYEGSIEKWKSIDIGDGNNVLFNGERHYIVSVSNEYNYEIYSSCKELGYTRYTCKHCTDSFVSNHKEMVEHDYISMIVEPSCVEGYTLYICRYDCGTSYKDNYVEKLDHFVVDGYCTGCNGAFDIVESYHDYESDIDKSWIVYKQGAEWVELKFSDKTEVEKNYDYIYIYDANGNLTGKYTGADLASQTIRIDGDTAKIRLVSDEQGTCYGFRAEYFFSIPEPTQPEPTETEPTQPEPTETEPTQPEATYLLGDANGDGKVNVKDATEIQKAVAGLIALNETENIAADVDANGKVNVKDATAIQKWVASIETGLLIGKQTTA